jgi:hypothetical protein
MKRILATTILLTLIALSAFGAATTVQVSAEQGFSTVSAGSAINITGKKAVYQRMYWYPFGTVSTCTVSLEGSADGSSGWSTIISGQTCTSAGSSTYTAGAANYVRPNLTTFTGGGSLLVVYEGWNGDATGVTSTALVPGTAATNLGKAEDAGHTTGDTGVMTLAVRKDTNAQVTNADADYTQISADAYGVPFSRSDHPNRIHCTVVVSTATTIQAVGSPCAAPGAGLSIYITDIEFGTSAAAGTAADSFPTLKSGTGGTCGTATAVIWQALTSANSTIIANKTTPIKVAANSEVCWIMTTASFGTTTTNAPTLTVAIAYTEE